MKKITDQSGLLGIFLCPMLAVQESHSLCRLLMDGRHYSQFTETVNSKLDRLRLFVVTWLAAELKNVLISYHLVSPLKHTTYILFLPISNQYWNLLYQSSAAVSWRGVISSWIVRKIVPVRFQHNFWDIFKCLLKNIWIYKWISRPKRILWFLDVWGSFSSHAGNVIQGTATFLTSYCTCCYTQCEGAAVF